MKLIGSSETITLFEENKSLMLMKEENVSTKQMIERLDEIRIKEAEAIKAAETYATSCAIGMPTFELLEKANRLIKQIGSMHL